MVIGLEVHCELATKTKIFCGCPTTFGAEPNTQCCPVCMGMPGTLPVLNKQVVEYAVKAGIATNCSIAPYSKQDRKNYFYPDLPKAYQISQFDLPLCQHGWLEIESGNGTKRIGITRIHIEEDAGKLIHDDVHGTMIDCNRCGVPLIEIVSEPDIRSAEEAVAYCKKLRSIIMYAGVSDCKMQEGSMRCDINLSVRKKGQTEFGTRTEMKNLNSFTYIQKAIEYEYKRQVEEIENGGVIIQETRRYDQSSGKTFSMRKKENANDYRYFPEPDLVPVIMSEEKVSELGSTIPMLPDVRKKMYVEKYSLTAYDAELITGEMAVADYFESAVAETEYPKLLVNLLISEILKVYDPDKGSIGIDPMHLAQVADMQGSGEINSSVAKKVVNVLLEEDTDACEYVRKNDLGQINDENILNDLISQALSRNPKSVEDYKKGKVAAAKALMGQVMGATKGRGNPVLIEKLLNATLESLKG
ncbi:MAG: Asp-tRNA(Asn)/Glu-tRNA(Gln) amidotransferase subunit GatB [Clostridia bacterium]|nr:Asp-tRNA(Asn)/Glu-tRNA(Gln) amidotransferase subunit GatB [Clostridia bacterium]